jgi:hypothetical protein
MSLINVPKLFGNCDAAIMPDLVLEENGSLWLIMKAIHGNGGLLGSWRD